LRRRPKGCGAGLQRRGFVGVLLSLPLLAAAATEALPMRRAKFRESGDKVKMALFLPALLRTSDRDAMDQVSAGFATRIVFDLEVFRWGEKTPVHKLTVAQIIYFDIFNEEYVVEQSVNGRFRWAQRRSLRDDAVRLVCTLDTQVCTVAALERGPTKAYVVRILARRNPIDNERKRGAGGLRPMRGQGWFADWVGAFVAPRPRAEYTLEARSSAFYLVEP